MILKKFTTRWLSYVFFLLILFPASRLFAQDALSVSKKKNKWYVPDYASAQFAGSIGFVSVGTGYNLFHDRANLEVLFGYLPESIGGRHLETATLKFNATPWNIKVNDQFYIQPLTTGVYFCYTFGREYSSDLPSWYPDGYYWWSEAVRANIYLGSNGRVLTPRSKRFERIDFYYELGTNEIKLVSYAQNSNALSFGQILHLGIGMRFHFRKS